MRKNLFDKILFFCFYINILFLLLPFFVFILAIIDSEFVFEFLFNSNNDIFVLVNRLIIPIPVLFLWAYNIWFAYKYDRYNKAVFFLIFLSFIYSPYYYYQIKIKRRPLNNEMEEVTVLGNSMQMENYQDDAEFEEDLKNNFN